VSELWIIARGSIVGTRRVEWFHKYFLAMLALPMVIVSVVTIFFGSISVEGSIASWAMFLLFLLGVVTFALALPDDLPAHRKGRDHSAKVYWLLPVQALIIISVAV